MLLLLTLCFFPQILRVNPLPSLGAGFKVITNVTGVLPAECPAAPNSDGDQQLRSVSNIVQSCLFTILACVWTSIHPNMNGPRDSWWAGMKRRIVTTVYAVIAPEMVLMWALRQRFAAKKIAEHYNRKFPRPARTKMNLLRKLKSFFHDICGLFQSLPEDTTWRGNGQLWTTTHAFFVLMGGFILYKDGYPEEVLNYKHLETLIRLGHIEPPTVTERELQDRSKGDIISKGIVVLQSLWFVLQCIVRAVQHLPLSELEVVTLAFAVMNGAIYAAWWEKPQGVDTAICIPSRQVNNFDSANGASSQHPGSCQTNDKHSNDSDEQPLMELELNKHTEKPSWLRRNLQEDHDQHGLPVFILIRIPLRIFVWLLSPLGKMLGIDKLIGTREDLRMPMFGIENGITSSKSPIFIAFTVGLIFGAIHLLGWTIQFPSPHDRILWQISAVVMTVGPFAFLAGGLISEHTDGTIREFVGIFCEGVFAFLIPLYIIARFVVIAIAFRAILHPPHDVLVDVSWTRYIPHF